MLLVAEAVSNLHQFLLADYLLATVDDPDVLVSVIEERMGYSLRYLFTMPLLARQIREEGQPAIQRLIELLQAGASADPVELLLTAGIDMRGPEPMRAAFELL